MGGGGFEVYNISVFVLFFVVLAVVEVCVLEVFDDVVQ